MLDPPNAAATVAALARVLLEAAVAAGSLVVGDAFFFFFFFFLDADLVRFLDAPGAALPDEYEKNRAAKELQNCPVERDHHGRWQK